MLADLFDPAFADSVARIAAPILLASLGGAICHRAGVFNIALEGFILMGAFAAVLGSFMLGHVFWGVLCAIVAGIFMGLIFAEFHLRRPGDAIVVSIALNLIGLGLTTYLLRSVLGVSGVFQNEAIGKITEIKLPLIENLPLIGSFLSGQSILFYLAIFLVFFLHYIYSKHKIGFWMRAAGENPLALKTTGIKPTPVKLLALVLCGACCGLAGAQLSVSNVSLFVENMSAGRGWIAVVIVLVTNGRPIPLLGLVLLFGFVDSLSLRLQGFGFPQQFTEMMPYVASLIALIFVSIRRMKDLISMRGYDNG